MQHGRQLLNLWVILGALGLACFLMMLSLIGIGLTRSSQAGQSGFKPADLTIIPGPSSTPSPMPTVDPALLGTPTAAPGEIAVGSYVQITGTGGDGLRMRSDPGLSSELLFLGYDSEVFQVKNGPEQADGYTWWYLVAPYDETRAGWAAADYLAVIPPPQN
jgi:hypothetical protein